MKSKLFFSSLDDTPDKKYREIKISKLWLGRKTPEDDLINPKEILLERKIVK